MKRKVKLITIGATTALGVSTGATIALSASDLFNNKQDINFNLSNKDAVSEDHPLYKAQSNGQNSFLSTKDGPLVYWKDTITALDWFGAERWHIDMGSIHGITDFGSASWKRNWYNWDYDRTNNILWVLSFGTTNKYKKNQTVYGFDGNTGNKIASYEITEKGADFKFITALSSGNVMVYGGATLGTYDATAILVNRQTGKAEKIQGDSAGTHVPKEYEKTSKMYLFNIFSIGKNKNIVAYVNADKGTGTSGDQSSTKASYNVYFSLVDDNLNMIEKSPGKFWTDAVKVVDGVEGYRNTTITPQRDYYFLLDGRVVTILYNTVVIINPNDTSSSNNSGVSIEKYSLEKDKWVLSWTFDNEENLFLKYKNDGKIYKVKASDLRSSNANNNAIDVPRSTYFDLTAASGKIKEHANDYVLYNVYGYSGQIMLINASYSDYINNNEGPSEEQIQQKQYGLAVAITQNKSNPLSGDSKGFLNGPDSILKSASFYVNENSLQTKLPSEITRNDITITNDGFFTSNKTTENDNKTLKYPPFKLENINDKEGTFTVVANIDQIPWFASTLPSDATPKTIKIEYSKDGSKAQQISSKTSWKNQSDLSYDFKNMLPTDVKVSDIDEFDPFQVSFNSRTVINSNGQQEYPKKTYSIGTVDDVKGEITINVKYDYMPVSNEISDVQSYSTSFKYEIFKSSQTPHLYFAGSDKEASVNTNSSIDIRNVPQLKALSQSNLLPSSFNSNDKNSFLQFINTNKSEGYPISRMSFSVQANDSDGSLIITATSKGKSFTQKYVGFNQVKNYNFSFNQNDSIDGKTFSTMLPSSVNEGDIIDNLVTYSGFNSSDFKVTLYPDDGAGKLNVKIELNRDYASNLGNNYGFKDYIIQKEFSGFMTTDQYNNKFNIAFRDNGDEGLVEIKKLMLSTIKNAIDQSKEIVVGKDKYTNLNDLVEKVFVKTQGTNIPKGWSGKEGISTSLAINNQAGTMNISISIDKSLLGDYGSNLNYVISYTGFANGNIVETEDNLSFVDQNLLKKVVPDVANMKPSEMAQWLTKKENLLRILFTYTGKYVDAFRDETYELFTTVNDTYGTISITIKFSNDLSSDQSLNEYSVQYNLYQ